MKHEISTKILIAIGVIILLAPLYDGYRVLGDRFATWKNNGFETAEARCAVLFTETVGARKIK